MPGSNLHYISTFLSDWKQFKQNRIYEFSRIPIFHDRKTLRIFCLKTSRYTFWYSMVNIRILQKLCLFFDFVVFLASKNKNELLLLNKRNQNFNISKCCKIFFNFKFLTLTAYILISCPNNDVKTKLLQKLNIHKKLKKKL